ncbi:MAG: protein kinase [Sandaracinaceae bacterium]
MSEGVTDQPHLDAATIPQLELCGRYVMGDRIGYGASAEVYEGHHVSSPQIAAIKLLREEWLDHPELFRRFELEAEALAAIRSRHVPQVFDAGTTAEGRPYVTMERVSGRSLARRLHDEETLSIDECVELGIQLAAALEAAHAAGFLHRDVKPDNLVLHDESDGTRVLKLIDFGVCARADRGTDGISLPGQVVGTPAYMPPEQARAERLDARADVYSAGLVLYEMLIGETPFDPLGASAQRVLLNVLGEPAPKVRSLRPDCPPELADLIDRSLAKEPSSRPASAAAMRDALQALHASRRSGIRLRAPETFDDEPVDELPGEVWWSRFPWMRAAVLFCAAISGAYVGVYAYRPDALAQVGATPPAWLADAFPRMPDDSEAAPIDIDGAAEPVQLARTASVEPLAWSPSRAASPADPTLRTSSEATSTDGIETSVDASEPTDTGASTDTSARPRAEVEPARAEPRVHHRRRSHAHASPDPVAIPSLPPPVEALASNDPPPAAPRAEATAFPLDGALEGALTPRSELATPRNPF